MTMKITTFVMRYQHGNTTVTRHFKTIDSALRHYYSLINEISGVQMEKLETTRKDLTNILNRLEGVGK